MTVGIRHFFRNVKVFEILWRLYICSGIVGLKWFYGFRIVRQDGDRGWVFNVLVCFDKGYGIVNDIKLINRRCSCVGFRVLNRLGLSGDEVLDFLLCVEFADGSFGRDPYVIESGGLRSNRVKSGSTRV